MGSSTIPRNDPLRKKNVCGGVGGWRKTGVLTGENWLERVYEGRRGLGVRSTEGGK